MDATNTASTVSLSYHQRNDSGFGPRIRAAGRYFCKFARSYSEDFLNYRSDVYGKLAPSYDPVVVWQFWGRAAEASRNKLRDAFNFHFSFPSSSFSVVRRPCTGKASSKGEPVPPGSYPLATSKATAFRQPANGSWQRTAGNLASCTLHRYPASNSSVRIS
jgi:hypothetical protein